MHKIKIWIRTKKPSLIAKSLLPDLKDRGRDKVRVNISKNSIQIELKAEKISHLKGMVNTYLDLTKMLIKANEEVV